MKPPDDDDDDYGRSQEALLRVAVLIAMAGVCVLASAVAGCVWLLTR